MVSYHSHTVVYQKYQLYDCRTSTECHTTAYEDIPMSLDFGKMTLMLTVGIKPAKDSGRRYCWKSSASQPG